MVSRPLSGALASLDDEALDNRSLRGQQDAIGVLLRDLYDRVASEPLPPEFERLLSSLDRSPAPHQ
jgi:hypothetical protein